MTRPATVTDRRAWSSARFSGVLSLALRLSCLCVTFACGADTVRTQTIQLRQGWNSVFLEVSPPEFSPPDLFGALPVDVVAAFYPATTSVQFVSDPAEQPWQKGGWGVWYAPERPEAMFSSLTTILGNRPYLINARKDVTFSVTGSAQLNHVPWKSNSFNYVGFGLDPADPPTFAEFFAGAKAHAGGRCYRLVSNKWRKVTSPSTTLMRSGEAYWIYCTGRSAYQGPVAVSFAGLSSIDFGASLDTIAISLSNVGLAPETVRLDAIPPDALPLVWVEPDWETFQNTYPALQASTDLPTIEPGVTDTYRIHLRREKMPDGEQGMLLKLTTDSGQVHWIPVTAKKGQ
ncbi:MAG: hypothetical protein HN742_32520 [Lentisphaerae bacterium]|jgi:hypothetical protein|nr:hypothetical protein [Lentisphaerota bacterium]MBT4816989.1 hypothetical protein [Lentisphaerota bacterium]MBT5609317.1 hypothetical protein [Lentisphaerota bacterium]MBT7058128.1 hypothetical protein [Lentisphaerota bacterium]MBT7846640.1 hypothetical protein [Lentisphaerota bacterium]